MKNIPAINYLFILILSTAFASCRKYSGSLSDTRTIDNISYSIYYLPDYAKQAMITDSIELADLDYYRFSISEEKINGRIADLFKPSNYNRFLYYLNRNIENDFKSVHGTSEMAPVQVFFESNNRIANKLIFLLAFEKNKQTDETTIVFNDNIFNNGLINFKHNNPI